MSHTLPNFIANATLKATAELLAAFDRLPEGKQNWKPESTSRSALDQLAECTLLNGYSADLILARKWTMDVSRYFQEKEELAAQDIEQTKKQLQENSKRIVAAIQTLSPADLDIEIELPWTKQTLAECIAYPYWNMTYHQGQINYIASMLGSL